MWVFGYGSLMTDGWQKQFGCREIVTAELMDYARTFNKKSVARWGTPDAPGPTLNLVPAAGKKCTGIAFRFEDDREGEIREMLSVREGKGFVLDSLGVCAAGRGFTAIVPIYRGRNIFDSTDPDVLAVLALNTGGEGGLCKDYIDSIYRQLQNLGIDDPAVSAIWRALQQLRSQQG